MISILTSIAAILISASPIGDSQRAEVIDDQGWTHYYQEGWYSDPAPYPSFGRYPTSGLSAYTEEIINEPFDCYPLHSGNQRGVTDTVAVAVNIQCNDTTDWAVGSNLPQTWFMPVIYNALTPPDRFQPIGDSTNIRYAFQGWMNSVSQVCPAPTVLPKDRGGRYALLYYVWNLPLGRTRLLFVKTNNAPANLTMLLNYTKPVCIANPVSVADTINAYGAWFWRACQKGNFTLALGLCDSMLTRNQSCAPAYILKMHLTGTFNLGDSLQAIRAADSTIAILQRYGDPAMGDPSKWGFDQRIWRQSHLEQMIQLRTDVTSGVKRGYRI